MIDTAAQRIDCRDDLVMAIADHAYFCQAHADLGQRTGQMVGVGVAGAAREDLVSDHQHGCGGLAHL